MQRGYIRKAIVIHKSFETLEYKALKDRAIFKNGVYYCIFDPKIRLAKVSYAHHDCNFHGVKARPFF